MVSYLTFQPQLTSVSVSSRSLFKYRLMDEIKKLYIRFKRSTQLICLCISQNSSFNVCLMKIIKITVTKKVIVRFNNLGEENFQKVAALVIFPTSIMFFFLKFIKGLKITFSSKWWKTLFCTWFRPIKKKNRAAKFFFKNLALSVT